MGSAPARRRVIPESDSDSDTDGTEEYNLAQPRNNVYDPVIELEDTQAVADEDDFEVVNRNQANEEHLMDFDEDNNAAAQPALQIEDEDDDDVVLIPEHIEVIDLCTQAVQLPREFRPNEVIEIQDSPLNQAQIQNSRFQSPEAVRRRRRRRGSDTVRAVVDPYPRPTGRSPINQLPTPPRPTPQRLNLDESQDEGGTRISCPICLESIIKREPVSTNCGHLFCKNCIQQALQNVKKCPMCKKSLPGKSPFHKIYLP